MSAGIAVALTIAGSDSSGGAGIQADLKTFTALGVYGASVITALTAQNTRGVQGVALVDADFVCRQLDSVLGDLPVTAIKTGMLATADIACRVADRLAALPDMALVVDPVMVATSGDLLMEPAALGAYRNRLLPCATLVTPNLPEAARLLDEPEAETCDAAIRQARALALKFGTSSSRQFGLAVLLKGGHAMGDEVVDVLCIRDEITLHRHRRVKTRNTHGTGCTLSAAITARLAGGMALHEAVASGIAFLCAALDAGASLTLGAGHGPVDHLFAHRVPAERVRQR